MELVAAGGTSTISELYTVPAYRRRGIADHILALLIQSVRELGCRETVCISTEPYRPFLERFSFQDLSEEDDDGAPVLSDEMVLSLA